MTKKENRKDMLTPTLFTGHLLGTSKRDRGIQKEEEGIDLEREREIDRNREIGLKINLIVRNQDLREVQHITLSQDLKIRINLKPFSLCLAHL
jgi:hypothetical protein